MSLGKSGHEVSEPVPLRHLSENQAKVNESRWVIAPRSDVVKVRFVGKGFIQIIDEKAKHAHITVNLVDMSYVEIVLNNWLSTSKYC